MMMDSLYVESKNALKAGHFHAVEGKKIFLR